ncbi:ABC transporter ATP-binding protein [Halobacterium salinarum]|uniref:ABC transporter ATP-binding protein n=1 Tax=Halobacterium salinarum TaxID=2242 RepID=UPI0025558324|nr:ABC transporter ATP-binding protein [Halobacterium salinarum]MDL0131896.1 ABC transporter ATP-binding protein [Halobacterium salinarum]
MVRVSYDNITKRYGNEIGIEDVNITVEDGEFAVLLGPSGCGKTTTLRCLAGLTEPTSGSIFLDGRTITDTHPKNRDIAMVFQALALYPHMNVAQNIAYPLKVAGVDKQTRRERAAEVAETLDISELLERETDELSGGQRQRVAIGRAIVRRPSVFLMDEPLASLDAKLKVEMRNEIKKLQRDLGITTLYVTHDQEEAMTLGDKLIVMHDSEVQQVGSPHEVYHDPANQFVAGFIGSPSMNFLRVRRADHSTVAFDGPQSGSFAYDAVPDSVDDEPFVLGVRPQYFDVSQSPADGAFEATVTVTEPMGDEQLLTVTVGEDRELSVRVPIHVDVTRGETVWLAVDADRTYVFDPETGARLEQSRGRARPATPD